MYNVHPNVFLAHTNAYCSYQEVLGESSSNNTMAQHHVEAIVVSMGQLKKSVVNTREEM